MVIKAKFINNKVSCVVVDTKGRLVYATINGSKIRWMTLGQLNYLLARIQARKD
jgi:hypothetical protein